MRAAWRLGINAVSARRSRSALLIAVVALAAVLISAVGVAMGSLRAAIEGRVEATVGRADARLRGAGSGSMVPASAIDAVRGWPEVEKATGRIVGSVALRFAKPAWVEDASGAWMRRVELFAATAFANGIIPDETLFRPIPLRDGRLPAADDEIVIDELLAKRLSERQEKRSLASPALALLASAPTGLDPMKRDPGPEQAATREEAERLNAGAAPGVGDVVEAVRLLREPVRLRIVGLAAQPPLGGRPIAYMTASGLAALEGKPGQLSEIDVKLRAGVDAEGFVAGAGERLPAKTLMQTTERITSGLDRNMKSNQIGFLVASIMSFIAAGFIIMTGMSVGVVERQRELGMLRCVGATRLQLAQSQLCAGGIIGTIGAAIGVPIGVAAAAAMVWWFEDRLRAPVVVPWDRVVLSFAGAVFSGVLGASFAAWQAARVPPLRALAARARGARRSMLWLLGAVGLACVLTHLGIFVALRDGELLFWSYVVVGLPALMAGYFMLGVPTAALVSRVLGGVIARGLGLPAVLLRRSVAATPYRFGFTAGAMMAGLALMVAIWTQGGSAVRDWLAKIEFPDAFVAGLNLTEESRRELEKLPFVRDTCAVALHPVETRVFGVGRMTSFKSFFVAFDPDAFFRMARLTWVEGDPETARRRLNEGGAVIVAREFLNAKGLGVGDEFVCWDQGREFRFEIVGVVASPGLEMVSKFFQVGEEFTDQSLHAVFGSRADLRDRFGSEMIGLIQMTLDPAIDDEEAMRQVRERLFAAGIIDAGSGRQIKQEITRFVESTLLVSSMVAVFAMFVACFGVANLIVAGVQTRQFEFGVLRAVGAERRVVTRLVVGEALVVALAACVLGTLMGVQGAFGGIRLNKLVWGVEMALLVPWREIAVGCGFVVVMTLGAAAPAVIALGRREPRELLGAMRG